jgi:synaptotagmin-like protein
MISLQNRVFDNPQPQWYPLEERVSIWQSHVVDVYLIEISFSLHTQSEPFEDVTTYRGDIIVGLKFIPGADSSGSTHSHGLSLRKFSIKSNSSVGNANNGSTGPTSCSKNTKGSLHIMVKEAKHLSPVKANGNCDAFCKRWVAGMIDDLCM